MGHGSQRREAQLHRVVNIAGARELFAHGRLHGLNNLFLPGFRETSAGAVLRNTDILNIFDGLHFCFQTSTPFRQILIRIELAVVALVDDGKNRNLKHDGVQPRTSNANLNIGIAAFRLLDLDTGALEMEEFQKVDEVALHKAQAAQIVQLVFAEMQRAQVINLFIDRTDHGLKVGSGISTLEFIFRLSGPGTDAGHTASS